MAWETSDRASRLPSNWSALRLSVLRRDAYMCSLCGAEATEVDHIEAGDDHSLENLQAICGPCHRRKSHRESVQGRMRRIAELRAMTRRKPEPNPGYIPPSERKNRPAPNRGW